MQPALDGNIHFYLKILTIKKLITCYIFTEPLLPATYTAFYGERKNNINKLYWQTLTETNLQNMVVERSTDGINFNTIATVTPQHKATAYKYDDATAPAGVSSYY